MTSHPFRPLRRRAVLLVWGAGVVSDIGTWMQMVVVGSLVAKETNSAIYTGITALAFFAPQGVCSPIGGLLADRFERKKVFKWSLAGQFAATLLLAAVLGSGHRNPFLLSSIIVLISAAGSFGQPSYQAMLPDLVPREELMAMVSLGIYSWNAGRILGPVLGTLAASIVGPSWTIFINALSFAVMSIAVALLRKNFYPTGELHETILGQLKDGLRAVKRVAGVRYGISLIMGLNLFLAGFMGLIPIYAHVVFHGGRGLTGAFSAMQGIGAIVGSLAATIYVDKLGRSRMLATSIAAASVAYGAYALAPNSAAALIVIPVLGASVSAIFVTGMAIVQRDAPNSERGRVMSITNMSMGTCYGVGILLLAIIGDVGNLRLAFGLGSIATAVAALVATRLLPNWRAAVDGPLP